MADVPQIFDRALLRQRLRRAERRGPATFLLERAAGDLAERLDTVKRDFAHALDFGTPGADAISVLMAREGIKTVALSDDPVVSMGGLRVTPDMALGKLKPRHSAMLVLPGGTAWDKKKNQEAAELAADFLASGVPVAAIWRPLTLS